MWVGNADNEPMKEVSGISGAAPIWHDVMLAAHRGQPVTAFAQPQGLVRTEVCALSGLLPTAECPHRVMEIFIAGTEPTCPCAVHQRIDGVLYTVLPPEAHDWAREHHIPQPLSSEVAGAGIQLTSPDEGAVYRIDPNTSRDSQRIAVEAETQLELQHLTILVDGVAVAELNAPPYAMQWQLTPGTHTFLAVGTGALGETVQSNTVRIIVEE